MARKIEDLNVESRPVIGDISVVIPTLGRPILAKCLESIAQGNRWPTSLIVVDQGSNQQVSSCLERLDSLGIRSVHSRSSQRGRASGVNRGLEQVKTRYVAITDDDCFVDQDWLENMVKRLTANPESIVTGRVDPAGDQEVMAVVQRDHPAIYRRPRLKFDAMSGGNMGTSSDVISRVGLFDEDPCVRCAEDGEWAYRALRAGIPIIYAPEVRVKHYGWRNPGQRIEQYQAYARSHGAFYGKYLRKGDWFIALRAFLHYLRALVRMIKGGCKGNREQEILGRAYVTGLLPGILAGLGKGKTW